MRKIVFSLIVLILVTPVLQVFAQDVSTEKADQKSVQVFIEKDGKVNVIHEIRDSDQIRQLSIIPGKISNLSVKNESGDEVQHELIDEQRLKVFPTNENVLIKYDLDDVLLQRNGVWTWEFLYLESTKFKFPKGVGLVFVNDNPVLLQGTKWLTCHGCSMLLEYVNEDRIIEQKIQWEEKEFTIRTGTFAEISSINFNQPERSISFDFNSDKTLVTMVIPLELLWNPYEVYLNSEKIKKHEFLNNGTHVWLNFKPESAGMIEIIGTSVIPEFPIFIPLVLAISMVLAFQFRSRIILR